MVPGGSGRFRVGSAFYLHPSKFPTSINVSTIILRLRKVECIKLINVTNVLFIGFVNKGFRRTNLTRLPTARVFFLSHFLKEKRLYLSSSC